MTKSIGKRIWAFGQEWADAHFTRWDIKAILLIFIIGLLVFTWSSPGLVVDSFDYGISFAPDRTLTSSMQLWNEYGGVGTSSPRAVAGLFPNNLYYFLSESVLHIPPYLAQSSLFYAIFAGSGISVYLLFMALGLSKKYPKGAIFASMAYMFSPIASTFLWNQFASNYYSYAFIPLIAALAVYSVRNGKSLLWALAIAGIWTLLLTASYMNPVNAIMDWGIVFGLLVAVLVRERLGWRELKRFIVPLILVWTLINLFWIVPNINNAPVELNKADVSFVGISNEDLLRSNSVSLDKSFLQTGYWALYATYKGDHWYSWSWLADSLIFNVACLFIALAAHSSIFIRPRPKYALFLSGTSIFCLIMINGTNPPFGDFLIGAFNQFPALYSLRSIYQKFGPVLTLCYSMMIGITMGYLIARIPPIKRNKIADVDRNIRQKLRRHAPTAVTMLIVGSLLVLAIPYANGQIIYEGGKVLPSARVQVPGYYAQANEWLDQQPGDFRAFTLPYCKIGYAAYSWENGLWAADPSATLFNKVVITTEYGDIGEVMSEVAGGIANGSCDFNPQVMLSFFNVRYIILHEDANWEFINGHSWWAGSNASFDNYTDSLSNYGFIKVATFDQLHIYLNPKWIPMHFNQPGHIVLINNLTDLKNLTEDPNYNISKTAFLFQIDSYSASLLSQNLIGIGNLSRTRGSNQSMVTEIMSSPTEHEIVMSPGSRILVFTERYDAGWSLHGSEEAQHIKINGFFNGWIVKNTTTNVTLVFEPQKQMEAINTISLTVYIVLVGLAIFIARRPRD